MTGRQSARRPRLLMGVETEYAYAGSRRDGTSIPRGEIVSGLLDMMRRKCATLPSQGGLGDVFLANGGRFYIDCSHPEFATPECADPWTAARYVRAGERLLTELGTLLEPRWGPGAMVSFFRFQVDYQQPGVTWGCHESYLNRTSALALRRTLVPHLVSRVLYTGAGGFNPKSDGLEFTISPRAWVLEAEVTGDSTGNRGILHTRDEPLAGDGWKRLHLLCGESLGSDLASVLRLGTTALVVAAAEAGAIPVSEVHLKSPLQALRRFAADPSGRATARLEGGGTGSALDLQWTYLRAIERLDGAEGLPAWAGALCKLWRETLERIEREPESLSRSLDWAFKKALVDQWLDRRLSEAGYNQEWVSGWTKILNVLREGLDGTESRGHSLAPLLRTAAAPLVPVVSLAKREARKLGIPLETLDLFMEIRQQAQEIDVRVGEIGRGIFDDMTRTGQMDHRLFDDAEVAQAVEDPPDVGRARLRGRAVRQLSTRGPKSGWAAWNRVVDTQKKRQLLLHDPWQKSPSWEPTPDLDPELTARLRRRGVFDFGE